MRIVSWNVNGLRACAKKVHLAGRDGFAAFLNGCGADVVGLQEVRALPEQLPADVREPDGWHSHFAVADRPGYSGVAIYARHEPDDVETGLGDARFDVEGRFILARFGRLRIASVYFPKGSGKERDNSRVPYKLDFYAAVLDRVEALKRKGPVLVMGDYNTAHTAIDLARPKGNEKSSGFLPEERAEIDRWLDAGWVDVFRRQHPDEAGHYTWWRQWGDARANNVGWRIDYVLASQGAAKRVTSAFIWPHVDGSDHCPVGVDLD